ncbi:MAG: lipid-binding SYLF domain-containing protein [Syntrophobacteraceae bacterium]
MLEIVFFNHAYKLKKIAIVLCGVFLLGLTSVRDTAAAPDVVLQLAADVLTDSLSLSGVGIPKSEFSEARGLAIFPNIHPAEQLEGVAILRTESGRWSGPVFIRLEDRNLTERIKSEAMDIVFVLRSRNIVDHLQEGRLHLGRPGDAEAASSRLHADADDRPVTYKAYMRARQAFKIVPNVKADLFFDFEANESYYGMNYIRLSDILSGDVSSELASGNRLTCLLAPFSGTAQICRVY